VRAIVRSVRGRGLSFSGDGGLIVLSNLETQMTAQSRRVLVCIVAKRKLL
jgi:hypothetical protein